MLSGNSEIQSFMLGMVFHHSTSCVGGGASGVLFFGVFFSFPFDAFLSGQDNDSWLVMDSFDRCY